MRGPSLRPFALLALAVLVAGGPAARALAGPRIQVFLVPNDDDSVAWATKLGGMIEHTLHQDHDLRVIDLTKVFGVKEPAAVARARQTARASLKDGIQHFTAVEFGPAIASFQKALKILRKQAAWINDVPEYPKALAYLAAAYILQGDTQDGKAVYRELLLYQPDYQVDTKTFDPSLKHLVAQVRQGIKSGSMGSVSVYSKPSGARIFLDGKHVGFTPASLDKIPTGRHVMRIESLGTQPWGKVVNITPTEDATVHAGLRPTPDFKKVQIVVQEVGHEFARGKVGTAMIKLGQYVGCDWVVYGVVSHTYGEVNLDTWVVSMGSQKRLATRRTNFPDGDFNLQANIDSFIGKLLTDARSHHDHMVTSSDPLDRESGTGGWFGHKGANGKKRDLNVDDADKSHKKSSSDDPLDNEDGTEGW